jgi:hypothetical protein
LHAWVLLLARKTPAPPSKQTKSGSAKRRRLKKSYTRKIWTSLAINDKEMKKLVLIAVVLLAGAAMSACNRNACPAFTQVETPAEARA